MPLSENHDIHEQNEPSAIALVGETLPLIYIPEENEIYNLSQLSDQMRRKITRIIIIMDTPQDKPGLETLEQILLSYQSVVISYIIGHVHGDIANIMHSKSHNHKNEIFKLPNSFVVTDSPEKNKKNPMKYAPLTLDQVSRIIDHEIPEKMHPFATEALRNATEKLTSSNTEIWQNIDRQDIQIEFSIKIGSGDELICEILRTISAPEISSVMPEYEHMNQRDISDMRILINQCDVISLLQIATLPSEPLWRQYIGAQSAYILLSRIQSLRSEKIRRVIHSHSQNSPHSNSTLQELFTRYFPHVLHPTKRRGSSKH